MTLVELDDVAFTVGTLASKLIVAYNVGHLLGSQLMKNMESAEAVIVFASSGRLFKPIAKPPEKFRLVIHSYEEALAIARLDDGATTTDGIQCIRTHCKALERELRSRAYQMPSWKEISQKESEAFSLIDAGISNNIGAYDDIFDDVLANLNMCFLSRLVDGTSVFWNEVFAAYSMGYWPCGLTESREVVIFVPSEDAKQTP